MLSGADDFLPVLISVVIHANVPRLASNLLYIERFRMQSRMVSESAYFFTQLVPLYPVPPSVEHQGFKGMDTHAVYTRRFVSSILSNG